MSDIIKVIWFVETNDEMEIRSKIGDRADFIFVKTLEEFKDQINKSNYLVYSVEKMNDSDDLTKLIHSNPDCIFHELFNVGKVEITESHALSRLEKNIKQGMWLDDILSDINSELDCDCDEIPNEETIKAMEDEELFSYDSVEDMIEDALKEPD